MKLMGNWKCSTIGRYMKGILGISAAQQRMCVAKCFGMVKSFWKT